ncbi:MAG: hypothetical protein HQM08_20245 [Candidatus Riflebacteria bacterium]|nr:hypothetical protein [Candidatus Riflebacteria bacterium]
MRKFWDRYAKIDNNHKPDLENYQKPLLEHLGGILHELLHAFQFSEVKQFVGKKDDSRTLLTKIDYPYQDSEVCLLLGLEGAVLADIVKGAESEKIRELWQDFVCVRNERRKRIHPDIVKLEGYMEINEGTAQYVQYSLNFPKPEYLKALSMLQNLPEFQSVKPAEKKDIIINFLKQLYKPSMSMYMTYVYHTGVAQAFLLDSLIPNWKTDFFRKYRSFDGLLVQSVSDDPGERLQKIKERYHSDEMMTKINVELGEIKSKNDAELSKFLSQSGSRICFSCTNVDPQHVQIIGTVFLIETDEFRVFKAGAQQIAFVGDTAILNVAFKKSVPIFFNKKTGEVFFINSENSALFDSISADSQQKISSETTEYSGNVKVDNTIFTFECPKLSLSQSLSQSSLRLF